MTINTHLKKDNDKLAFHNTTVTVRVKVRKEAEESMSKT